MTDIQTTWNSDPTLTEIRTMADLQRYFDANEPTLGSINRRLYKDTSCGAHLSVTDATGQMHHNGDNDWTGPITAIILGSIVEGSDAEVDGDLLMLPIKPEEIDQQIVGIESEANSLWHDANDTAHYQCDLCTEIVCDHEQDGHTVIHAPEVVTYATLDFAPA